MKNETEKLNKFKHAVFESAEGQAEIIVSDAKKQRDECIASAKLESENNVAAQLLVIDKKYESATVRDISSAKLGSKRKVLTARNTMIDKVFANVKVKLGEFCKGDAYGNFVKSKLTECAQKYPSEKGIAYFSYNDIELGKKLCGGTDFTADTKETIELGGVMIVYEDRNLAFDYTFDSAFSEERESFSRRGELVQGER